MIYTSNFGSYRKYVHLNTISIARYPIKDFFGVDIRNKNDFCNMVPSNILLKNYKEGNMTDKQYAVEYYKQIYKINWNSFFKKYDNHVLLCYEKKGDFCHRHVLSFYLRKMGYDIEEL